MKYELDKKTGMLALDRVLFTATYYPMNYGFIPHTYGDDCDRLDVLLLCSQPIQSMTIVRSYPIGVMHMEDSGMGDEKIIAIPYGDPTYMNYTDIKELAAAEKKRAEEQEKKELLQKLKGAFVHAVFVLLENGYFAGLAVTRLSIFHFHFYSLFLDRPADKCYNKIIAKFTCIL